MKIITGVIVFGILALPFLVLLTSRDQWKWRCECAERALTDANATIANLADSNTKLTRVVKGRAFVWATFSEN